MPADLHLAAVNGERTICLGLDPVAAWAHGLGDSIEAGNLTVEKAILVAIVDGAVTYTSVGALTVMEATGLLELCSRRIERDVLER